MFANLIQVILAVALTGVILLQGSSGGLGSAFGGSGSYHTKRGLEKSLFYLTIALSIAFTGSSIVLLI
jgi:preprotein translocase subunit SecG